eukprot:m.121776 g.121776  ORF g.121776 m.121776 type:complete len:455 (-) comp23299_c0_seq2:211-1575(-)
MFSSPLSQTIIVGSAFLLLFCGFATIQAFAGKFYNKHKDNLNSDLLSTVYATLTVSCFVAAPIVNRIGPRAGLILGAFGYIPLVIFSYVFIRGLCTSGIVIAAGALCGFSASVLWTAQGRHLLAVAQGGNAATLYSIFWGFTQAAAVAGGLLAWLYFSQKGDDANIETLFIVFSIISLSGCFLMFLLKTQKQFHQAQGTLEQISFAQAAITHDWRSDLKKTFLLLKERQILFLVLLFWVTAFGQPYQLNTFSKRFTPSANGLEVAIYYFFDMVGALGFGRLKDHWNLSRIALLLVVLASTMVPIIFATLAITWEPKNEQGDLKQLSLSDGREIALPTVAYIGWGLSDAVLQNYVINVIGELYQHQAQTRAVAVFKMLQSAGWCVGFALASRASASNQFIATSVCAVAGVLLAFFVRPPVKLPASMIESDDLTGESPEETHALLHETGEILEAEC